ncbi:MAG: SUF system NifU family Fe-S cluster assembly protein [Candidatus Aenigmarchaeota archaeon]|nr:SUF system NifU family Fe-S cluster assembly protein [Candidatus Aenigmarchaeota archaeon]MCX8179530.1 SUF system NifU family Fe-S cluster assembly protein [Candidatus Aenigmarchaeota archaeon]
MSDIYSEIILNHWKSPRNRGKIDDADVVIKDSNPLCGDEITMYMKFDDDKIKQVSFEGKGCAISQASASMLTEFVKGKSIDEIIKMNSNKVQKMLGVKLSATRLKCALLPLKSLKLGIYSYLGKKLAG